MKELPKTYEPDKYEDAIYRRSEESGFFNPDVCVEKGVTAPDAPPFSMALPPPNVTGTLHMGHATMLAIQDIMARYHRMKGERTLWLPGTDHAAVATESKVEALLISEEGYAKPKQELGREAFLERVRQFAQASHDTIVTQSKKMGSSLDWSREAYTLDEERNLAVRTVFKLMYDEGLIYRGYRVVNWSVKGQSTCSDDELVYVERPGKLYYFKYGPDFPITIATTRPETKLGDTAVAVHPEDERYQKFIGQIFTVDVGAAKPLAIKIIADPGIDPEFGTGALGVTPAHSPTDFEMYLREKARGNDIGLIPVIGEDGRMTQAAGAAYQGLTVEEARAKFVEWLRLRGLLEKEADTVQNVGTSDRFKDVVEPLPKTQWFVDVNKAFPMKGDKIAGIKAGENTTLKEAMHAVVKNGQVKIVPERFEATYFHWIDNLRDWCISRQIWFGHQIPVWYCASGPKPECRRPIVEVEAPAECPHCGARQLEQDPDTLDTWFSSGLWTFSTLGWPAAKAMEGDAGTGTARDGRTDFEVYHPTSVLETGYDILFFWVARMILMTTYALGDVPFKTVYLHGLVRDEQGRKMSKSLGNIIDPLDMIARYGTDATRLSLVLGTTPGNDVKLSEEKIAGFRNFTNKLWNIARFMLLNTEEPKSAAVRPLPATLSDRWILHRLDATIAEATRGIEQYNFSAVGERLRDFTWNELADWYLEIAKIEGGKSAILNYVLNTLLKLWHPYMPFVTEAIWREVYGDGGLLMVERYPEAPAAPDAGDVQAFALAQSIITGIRSLRAAYRLESNKNLSVVINAGERAREIEEGAAVIAGLARLKNLTVARQAKKPATAVGFVEQGVEVFLDLMGVVDTAKEKERLEKEIATVSPYVDSLRKKLADEQFVRNAPAAVVAAERQKLSDAEAKRAKLTEQLLSLL